MKNMNEQLDNMTLDELGGVVKEALSRIYTKLREDEDFGYHQHCSVISIGKEEYDVELVILDDVSHNGGLDWPKSWWI